jgi:peptide subunit release factor 1 (eRF1)
MEYWCHQCKKHITPIPAQQEDEEFMCPICQSCFIELIENETTDEELLQSAMETVFPTENIEQPQAQPILQQPQVQQTFVQQPFGFDFNGYVNTCLF